MYTVFVLSILTFSSAFGYTLIEPKLNPGCHGCSANDTFLVYIKAQDKGFGYVNHQIWDFTGHVPTILSIMGTKKSKLIVEWVGNKPTQILTNDTYYSFAVILNNLFEYNDTDDNGSYFDNNYPHREISLRDVTWRLDENVLTNDKAEIRVRGDLSWRRHRMNGTIDMKLLLVPSAGRSPSLPRLHHSVNTTQVDVELVGLSVLPQYTAARFALHYVLVGEGRDTDELRFSVQRSVDDEYTPGVFETNNVMTPDDILGLSGYLQYRPIAYTMGERDVENSVTAYVTKYNKTSIPRDCLVAKFYDKFDHKDVFFDEIVASFGQSGDGYYNKTKYTVWTYSVGYGTPPFESLSLHVILFLALGLATPVIGSIGAYFIVNKMMRRDGDSFIEEDA